MQPSNTSGQGADGNHGGGGRDRRRATREQPRPETTIERLRAEVEVLEDLVRQVNRGIYQTTRLQMEAPDVDWGLGQIISLQRGLRQTLEDVEAQLDFEMDGMWNGLSERGRHPRQPR
ncbi:hypothetical protein BC834DRAFT_843683 [Gloeopeniophorella convolvens]|nr:hypothetical protein BC834DRAFT_847547 [Gloeopeniophorella convolvens]KAI0265466.1 hypothetical protein BC834DRAFT_843683 [Gloeopeniophorella convolvens]